MSYQGRQATPVIGQLYSCDMCHKKYVAIQNGNRFCEPACREQWWVEHRPEVERECIVCNTKFKTTTKRKTCDDECLSIHTAFLMQKYSHEELVQLIMLNRGYGFHKFLKTTNIRERLLLMTMEIAKEETGVDLFSWLNGPEGLVQIKLDEHLANGHATPKNTKSIGTMRKKTMLKRYEQHKAGEKVTRTSIIVEVPREFNWGPEDLGLENRKARNKR